MTTFISTFRELSPVTLGFVPQPQPTDLQVWHTTEKGMEQKQREMLIQAHRSDMSGKTIAGMFNLKLEEVERILDKED